MNRIRYDTKSDRVIFSDGCQRISVDRMTLVEVTDKCLRRPDGGIVYNDPLHTSDRCDVIMTVDGVTNDIAMASFSKEDDAMEYAKELIEALESTDKYIKVYRNGIFAVRKDCVRAIKVI